MIEYLFVYGTLAPGRPNAHVSGNVPGAWEPATVGLHHTPSGDAEWKRTQVEG